MDFKKSRNQLIIIGSIIVAIAIAFTAKSIVENVDAEEIVVIQDPIDGDLHWYTNAGLKLQWFGKPTHYPKRDMYECIQKIRFNDAGEAEAYASVEYYYPLDIEHLTILHSTYGGPEAVKQSLIKKVVDKSIYMTGPLMSSRESYAEKRNALIQFMEDQIENGIYQTRSHESKTVDIMTGTEKTVTVVEIVRDSAGIALRQEEAVLTRFGFNPYNFAINRMPYSERVENQIKAQQEANMAVQTAIAEAKRAEQKTLTVVEEGKAAAAEAKWAQEAIKAKAVTEAEQKMEVAALQKKAAEFTKQEQILLGQGEAERKRLVMSADGALTQKLETYIQVNQMYAQAIASYTGAWVPNVVMGEGSQSASGAQDLINLLMVKTAKDLSLDMSMVGK